jgi:hypothetical protein
MKKLNGTRLARRSVIAVGAVAVASAVLTVPTQATPTWTQTEGVTPFGAVPLKLDVAVAADGDAVAVWREYDGANSRIAASSRPVGGVWTPRTYISLANRDADDPDVDMNAHGEAVATWVRFDGSKNRIQASRRLANLSWDGFDTLSAFDRTGRTASVEVAGNGTAYVAFVEDGAVADATKLSKLVKGQAPSTSTLSTTKAWELALSVNESGGVLAAWTQDQGDGQVLKVHTRVGGVQATQMVTSGNWLSTSIDAALSDDGRGAVVMPREVGDDTRIVEFRRAVDGFWSGASYISDPGENAWSPSVAMDDHRNVVVAYTSGAGVKVSSRSGASSWTNPQTLPGVGVTPPVVAMNSRGDATIQFNDDNHVTHVAFRPAGSVNFFQAPTLANQFLIKDVHSVGIDDQGNVVALHSIQLDGDTGRVLARVYDTAGPTSTMSKPGKLRTNGTTIPVAWSTMDRFHEVGAKDLLVRSAPWNAGFGPVTEQLAWSNANSTNVAGAEGRTYCFAARGIDTVGNMGSPSAWKCTTTPLDDRKATATGGFAKKTGSGYFKGTFRKATAKGATLKLEGVKADTIGLLVAKGKNNGKISVFFAGKKLGTWSLAATTNKVKQQILVKNFASVKTGTLVIKVVSAGKPVRIDGFHIVK